MSAYQDEYTIFINEKPVRLEKAKDDNYSKFYNYDEMKHYLDVYPNYGIVFTNWNGEKYNFDNLRLIAAITEYHKPLRNVITTKIDHPTKTLYIDCYPIVESA